MVGTIKKNDTLKHGTELCKSNFYSYWQDDMLYNFYVNYHDGLTSKQLDAEFYKNMDTLISTIQKLSDKDKKFLIKLLSHIIENYLTSKIERELDNSFYRLIKF